MKLGVGLHTGRILKKSLGLNYNPFDGLEFFSLGDSLSVGGVWQSKLATLANATFDNTKNVDATYPLSVGGTRTGGVNSTCGHWRARNIESQALNPDIIIIENINDLIKVDSSLIGTIEDSPVMLGKILTYNSGQADASSATTYWNTNKASIVASFTGSDRVVGAGIQLQYTGGYLELIFKGLNINDWEVTANWGYAFNSTLFSEYKGLINYLISAYPNARLYWMLPNRWEIAWDSGNPNYDASLWNGSDFDMDAYMLTSAYLNYEALVQCQKDVCDYYGVSYIDVNANSGISPVDLAAFQTYYNEYNVHPQTAGYEKWGSTAYSLIKTLLVKFAGFTETIITATSASLTSNEKTALDIFMKGIVSNNLSERINHLYLPVIAGDLSKAFVNVALYAPIAETVPDAGQSALAGKGIYNLKNSTSAQWHIPTNGDGLDTNNFTFFAFLSQFTPASFSESFPQWIDIYTAAWYGSFNNSSGLDYLNMYGSAMKFNGVGTSIASSYGGSPTQMKFGIKKMLYGFTLNQSDRDGGFHIDELGNAVRHYTAGAVGYASGVLTEDLYLTSYHNSWGSEPIGIIGIGKALSQSELQKLADLTKTFMVAMGVDNS